MIIGNHNTEKRVLIIAEIGNNHEGDVKLAKRMIAAAAEAGADAVKFQTLRAKKTVRPQDKARFETLKQFELTFDQFESLVTVAHREGVVFLSTPFDLSAAEFLNGLVPCFKIASGDNNFIPLIEKIASFGKPVIMSTGLAGLPEISYAKALIERIWYERGLNVELALLHCVTSYPAPDEEANLNGIRTLEKKFGVCVGYSDHCLGIKAAVMSVAVGARIVEKHFTLDKNQSDFRDHRLSADPNEMRSLVENIREIEKMLGSGKVDLSDSEKANMAAVRRSIANSKDLSVGHCLNLSDICWLRPGLGLAPGNESKIIGRTLKQDIVKGTILKEDLLE